MSKKFSLISGLEEDTVTPKIKFQLFAAEIGFERAEVLIPFDQADIFAEEAKQQQPKSKASLNKLASKFGGKVL